MTFKSKKPEDWVFNTNSFSDADVKRIFAAIQADCVYLTPWGVLVKPRTGHERAVRYICGHLFTRVNSEKALALIAAIPGDPPQTSGSE